MVAINQKASVKCSKTISIEANKEKVWSVLTQIDQWADWNLDISQAKLNGELRAKTSFDWKTNGMKIQSTLHTVEPYENFGWTGKSMGISAIHNWTLKTENDSTIVTVDESMSGFLAKLFKSSLNKTLEKGMRRWLDFLKEKCEK